MKAWFIAAAVLVATMATAQDAREPIAVQAAGTFPLQQERRVVLDGLSGDIVLQVGKAGEIRFLSQLMGKKDESPIAIYDENGVIVFRPVAGEPFTARTLQMTIPPEVHAKIAAPLGGKVTTSGLKGGIEIAGRGVTVDARGLGGDLEMDLEGGTVVASMINGAVRLRGKGCNATFDTVMGSLTISLVKGAVTARGAGSLEVDLDEVELKVDRITGAVNAVSRQGSIEATSIGAGGDFRLSGTKLGLSKSKGEFTVSSDADIKYKEMEAALHLDSYGGTVQGDGNKGIAEVRTRNASVQLANNQGAVRIQGEGATIKLSQIDGETVVLARTTDVTIDDVKGALTIECDRGDLVVRRSGPSITATTSGGDVRMEAIDGAITLKADGKLVDILWANISDTDSRIVNEGGDVNVRFSGSGGKGRIEAKSKSGRITSDNSKVRVQDDGTQAQGALGHNPRPVVVIEASNDIQILGGS